jgi:hypothetical protein
VLAFREATRGFVRTILLRAYREGRRISEVMLLPRAMVIELEPQPRGVTPTQRERAEKALYGDDTRARSRRARGWSQEKPPA